MRGGGGEREGGGRRGKGEFKLTTTVHCKSTMHVSVNTLTICGVFHDSLHVKINERHIGTT